MESKECQNRREKISNESDQEGGRYRGGQKGERYPPGADQGGREIPPAACRSQGEPDPGEEFFLNEENSIIVLEEGDDAKEILGIGKTPLEGTHLGDIPEYVGSSQHL